MPITWQLAASGLLSELSTFLGSALAYEQALLELGELTGAGVQKQLHAKFLAKFF